MKKNTFRNIYHLLEVKPYNLKQLLGEFGEYIYREYCRSLNLECKVTKYLRADLVIFYNNKQFFVDVKTTIKNSGSYKGPRPQKKYNYSYDQVFITKDFIKIFPDINSLLNKFNNSNEILIKNTDKKYQKYLSAPKEIKYITNSEKKRIEIRENIKKIFLANKLKCRILERGQVSEDNWKKHKPDNVPGKKNLYQKYDYNILINYKDIELDKEGIREIYLFKTNLIGNKIKLKKPTLNIQKKKNIEGLINYEDFKKNFPEYYFTDLNSFIKFIANL